MDFRRYVVPLIVAGVLCAAAGACDDRSDVPADVRQQEPERTPEETARPATTRPTTQELTEGPRVPTSLDILPLMMQVPPQWKIVRRGKTGMVFLEGPSPSTEVSIQLSQEIPIPAASFQQLLQGVRREQQHKEDPNLEIIMRMIGPAHVIERRSAGRPITAAVLDGSGMPVTDAKGDVVMHTMIPMRWSINVYPPAAGGGAENYELSFIGLEKAHYDADRAFLEGIVSTLRLTGSAAETGTTAPATAPAATQPAGLR